MLIDTLLFEDGPGELRSAALADGHVFDVGHHRRSRPSQVGAVYLGRVRRIMNSLNVAFVDLGVGADGFLRASGVRWPSTGPKRLNRVLQEGEALLVQVIRDAVADKGPVVTSLVALAGRFVDYTPGNPGPHAVPKLAAAAGKLATLLDKEEGVFLHRSWPDDVALAHDLDALRQRWEAIQAVASQQKAPASIEAAPEQIAATLGTYRFDPLRRVLTDGRSLVRQAETWCARYAPTLADGVEYTTENFFETFGVNNDIETALSPRVSLADGGNLIFEEGAVLTAVDVNSGAGEATPGRAALEHNLAAVPEIARQLRLRRCGGAIVVDFLKMGGRSERNLLIDAFRAQVAADPAGCHVLGLSGLGLLELTRRRVGPSLAEELLTPHPGRSASVETIAYRVLRQLKREGRARPGQPLSLTVAPALADYLTAELKEDLEHAVAGTVNLHSDQALQIDRFAVGTSS